MKCLSAWVSGRPRPQQISVKPEVLEKLAATLDVARVPVTLEPHREGEPEAFKPLKARQVQGNDRRSKEAEDLKARQVAQLYAGTGYDVPVTVHVYDTQVARVDSKVIQEYTGLPIYHVGVEVYQQEFSFSPDGILVVMPGQYNPKLHKVALPVGTIRLTNRQVLDILDQFRTTWRGDAYRLVGFNCQTFALQFCKCMGCDTSKVPPEYVRFADGWTQADSADDQDSVHGSLEPRPARIRL